MLILRNTYWRENYSTLEGKLYFPVNPPGRQSVEDPSRVPTPVAPLYGDCSKRNTWAHTGTRAHHAHPAHRNLGNLPSRHSQSRKQKGRQRAASATKEGHTQHAQHTAHAATPHTVTQRILFSCINLDAILRF